jgi:hypothetical protein
MKPDEWKSLVATLSKVIDAKANTTETVIKAHVSAEIHAAEERIKKELRAEILVSRAEAKADHLQLAGKIEKVTKSHAQRIDALEEETGSSNPTKN